MHLNMNFSVSTIRRVKEVKRVFYCRSMENPKIDSGWWN